MKLLHIKASPRGTQSHSLKAAEGFIKSFHGPCANLRITEFDVWKADLPPFDGTLLDAKYARLAKRAFTPGEADAWGKVEKLVQMLDSADVIVISTPMWNLSIPYRLKHYIDLVTQPDLSFSFDPQTGYTPLLRPRPVVAILASSGDFSDGPSWGRPDLATPYLQQSLKFIGLTDSHVVLVGPTAGQPEIVKMGAIAGQDKLNAIAHQFARADA